MILDVDLLAFEHGDAGARAAAVDGVRRSLQTGFVYTSHDLGEDFLDEAYGRLQAFFSAPLDEKRALVAPGSHGQAGYTGVLVETAATAEHPDWKEMLNWGRPIPEGHPLRTRYPHRYLDPVLPAGSEELLGTFHDRVFDVQRRFLRIIAEGLGAAADLFEPMLRHGPTLTRAIHYPPMADAPGSPHVWAAAHGDINLITALPRATARGLQVRTAEGWVDAVAPPGKMIINTGMMLEQLSNGIIPTGVHRVVADPADTGDRYSVVQFCHPTPWTVLTPLVSCVGPGQPQRYGAVLAADRLDEVLWEINLTDPGS